jgi:hypothetical protein
MEFVLAGSSGFGLEVYGSKSTVYLDKERSVAAPPKRGTYVTHRRFTAVLCFMFGGGAFFCGFLWGVVLVGVVYESCLVGCGLFYL